MITRFPIHKQQQSNKLPWEGHYIYIYQFKLQEYILREIRWQSKIDDWDSRRWSNPSWSSSSSSCCPHAPSPPPSPSPSAASCSTATCCWVDCASPAQSHTFNNRHRHSMQRKVERTVRQSAVLGSDGASSPPLLFVVALRWSSDKSISSQW